MKIKIFFYIFLLMISSVSFADCRPVTIRNYDRYGNVIITRYRECDRNYDYDQDNDGDYRYHQYPQYPVWNSGFYIRPPSIQFYFGSHNRHSDHYGHDNHDNHENHRNH